MEKRRKEPGLKDALLSAVMAGDAEGVGKALRLGADPDAADERGCPALHLAVRGSRSGIARSLLEAGADPDAEDEEGWRALHWACWERTGAERHPEAIALIRAGADFEARNKAWRTPLMMAVRRGNEQVAKCLLEAGADPNAIDREGVSPLMDAARRGREGLARALLEAGARAGHRDKAGLLAEDWHLHEGKAAEGLLELLRSHRLSEEERDALGEATAAAKTGRRASL